MKYIEEEEEEEDVDEDNEVIKKVPTTMTIDTTQIFEKSYLLFDEA